MSVHAYADSVLTISNKRRPRHPVQPAHVWFVGKCGAAPELLQTARAGLMCAGKTRRGDKKKQNSVMVHVRSIQIDSVLM